MIIEYYGMKCRYSTHRICGENRPILTLIHPEDWEKSLQYDFTEPQNGLWCHFITDEELDAFQACLPISDK